LTGAGAPEYTDESFADVRLSVRPARVPTGLGENVTTKSKLALGAALLACSLCGSGCGIIIASVASISEGYEPGPEVVPLGFVIDIAAGAGAGAVIAEEEGVGLGIAAGVAISAAMILIDLAIVGDIASNGPGLQPSGIPSWHSLAEADPPRPGEDPSSACRLNYRGPPFPVCVDW
jgi:hypothetical protein